MSRPNPQVERTRRAVLDAAGQVLIDRGFATATIDAVAQQSRVARSTIYRHWPDLPALLIEAFGELAGSGLEVPDTGDVREDLVSLFRALARGMTVAPSLRVLPSLADAATHDPRFEALLRDFIDARREPAREVLRRAVGARQLPPGTDVERLIDLIGAPLFYRRMVSRQPLDEPGLVEYLVDAGLGSARSRQP